MASTFIGRSRLARLLAGGILLVTITLTLPFPAQAAESCVDRFVKDLAGGGAAASHFDGNTVLQDSVTSRAKVNGTKFFLSYWFNSVSDGGSDIVLLNAGPDGSNLYYAIIEVRHIPGSAWQAIIQVNCIPQLAGQSGNLCDSGHDSNWAVFVFTGPSLPDDAPCECWHHLQASIDTSVPSGTYWLDNSNGNLSESTTSQGATFSGPGGTILYQIAAQWKIGAEFAGDLAELYLNTITTFLSEHPFVIGVGEFAAGLGFADATHPACSKPDATNTPEVCLRGNPSNFPNQAAAGGGYVHQFTVIGDELETALTDPCFLFRARGGCI